jgi:uncharacterized protein
MEVVMAIPEVPRRPAPILTDDNDVFWAEAAAGRLVAQRCGDCGRLRHPPRPMCPYCQSLAVEIAALSGLGALYSFAVLHHPQHPAFDYPVVAALVDLDEGIRLVSNVTDVATDELRIGMRLSVHFAPASDGASVPVFRPTEV